MITLEKPHSVRTSGILETGISFGIKADGLAHIFNVLRNSLYSNKILAVIREYSCNAYDAQIETGTASQQFIVTCPDLDDPSFKVRDFGSGLSPEGISEVYAYYGESTKRQSNAFIGQLGLGSKSGFAYGDNFVIKSFHKGILYTYNAYLDETKIGQILKMSEEPTSEADGVEIIIPVKVRDILVFKETIATFFKHFKSKPIVNNIEQEYLDTYWQTSDQVLTGEGWKFLKARNSWEQTPTLVVMGNVAYPVDGSSVDGLDTSFHTDFIVEFEIGELEVSASRESLQFSAKTQAAIKKRFKAISAEVAKTIADKIAGSKSLFEAKSIYHNLTSSSGDFYRFGKALKDILWNNQRIDNCHLSWTKTTGKGVRVFDISKSNRSERVVIRKSNQEQIPCFGWSRLYIDDTNHKFMQRLAHYVHDSKSTGISKIYAVEFDDDKTKKAWLAEVGMSESELTYTSSEKINKIKYTKDPDADSGPKDSKHSASEFKLDLGSDRWKNTKSAYFIETEFDLSKGGTYIHINHFYCRPSYLPGSTCETDAQEYINLLNSGFTYKGFEISYPKVACFKERTIEKILKDTNWKDLKTFVKDHIAANWTNGQSQKISNYIELQRFKYSYGKQMNYLNGIKAIKAISEFNELVKSFGLFFKDGDIDFNTGDSFIYLFSRVGLVDTVTNCLPATHSLSEEFLKIKEKYPILGAVEWYSDSGPAIVEKYLTLQEKSLTTL
jgi:hypothetical protein